MATNYLDVDYSCKYNCSLVDSDNDYGKTSCKINQAVSDFSDITLSTANTSLKARTPQSKHAALPFLIYYASYS
jgi:hypothetical protein